MDANTTKSKFISVALAALMVGSLLVSGFAAAHEEPGSQRLSLVDITDPSRSTNAVLHWDYDCDDDDDIDDCDDDEETDFYVDTPSGGSILYQNTYDLFFVAIPTCIFNDPTDDTDVADPDCTPEVDDDDVNLADGDEVSIWFESFDGDDDPGQFGAGDLAEGADTFDIFIDSEDVQHDRDEDHCDLHDGVYDDDDEECTPGVWAVAFEAITFEYGAGTYYLVRTQGDDMTEIGVFKVTERNELDVNLDPGRFTYIWEEEPEVDAVVTHDGDGVRGIFLESEDDMLPDVGEDDTSSSGRASIDFGGVHPPAGRWTIIARQDVSILDGAETVAGTDIEDEEEHDDTTIAAEPDIRGEATLIVDPAGLIVRPDSTSILSGFRQSLSYMVLFPEEDEAEDDVDCDGDEEGFNVAFPGTEDEETDDGEGPGCTNGLLYGVREFEVANLSVVSPNGDDYWLNMTFEDWEALIGDDPTPLLFCVDEDDDEEEDECGDTIGLGDVFEAPLLVTLRTDGTFVLTPNELFEHPLEDDVGPLSEDNRVWLSGTYNITVDVSTSGRGLIEGSYELTGAPFADWDDDEDLVGAADYPEYTASWNLVVGDPADLNLELFIDPAGGDDIDDAEAADSIEVQHIDDGDDGLPMQTIFVIVYGETINDHPLCDSDLWFEDDLDPATECADADENDELDDEETLAEAEEDFLDHVTVSGDLLSDFEVADYDAVSGVLTITGVTPTQAGNITVTIEWDGEVATLVIPVENGAKISLDVTEITVGEESEVIATVRDQFDGLVTTADLRLVLDDGSAPGGDFDMSPSSGAISGTGAAGRGLGGEYRYVVTPDTNQDLIIFAVVGEGSADETYAYALVSVAPAHDLNVELESADETMASLRTPVVLTASPGWDDEDEEFDIEDVSVWFIHEDGWEEFESRGGEALEDLVGDDADDFEWEDLAFEVETLAFREEFIFMNVTLPPGQFKILVCDQDCDGFDAAHDNADDMPTLTVHRYTATFTPAQIANDEDIQENVRIAVRVVDSEGQGASGVLRSVASTSDDFEDETEGEFSSGPGGTITAVITNGFGNFTGVTGAKIGQVAFVFNPTGPSDDPEESLVDGLLQIVGPNLTITPPTVRIGQVTLVTIQVRDFNGNGLAGRNVNLCTPGLNDFPTDEDEIEDLEDLDFEVDGDDIDDFCPTKGTTGADGSTTIAVNPTSTTPYRVYLNSTYSGTTIPVHIGTMTLTLSPTNPSVGDDVVATVALQGVTAGSNAGVTIRVTRDGAQFGNVLTTDAAGRATITDVDVGSYTVRATRTGFPDATATFTVSETPTPPCELEVSDLELPSQVDVGAEITVMVTVTNDCEEDINETATLFVNNNEQGSEEVSVPAGEEIELEFNFTPLVGGTYSIRVVLGNQTAGPETVTVGTPVPTTPTPTTPVTPTPTSPTTPVTPTPTSPTTPITTSPTTPTGGTPTTTSPRVPGFEVVALMAALGVALLVLRRK